MAEKAILVNVVTIPEIVDIQPPIYYDVNYRREAESGLSINRGCDGMSSAMIYIQCPGTVDSMPASHIGRRYLIISSSGDSSLVWR